MDYSVRYTLKAREDLVRLASYIALDNPDRAISFVSELEDHTTKVLALVPMSGRIYKNTTRFTVYGRFVILYKVNEKTKLVTVVHIVGGATNWKKKNFN